MAKVKFDVKDLLLKKGEYAVLGAAGLGLVLLLVMGVSKLSAAKDPKTIADKLVSKARTIDTGVLAPAEPGMVPELEEWAKLKSKSGTGFPPVPPTEFTLVTAPFDPVAKPDTKRENPKVLSIGEYQVDLVRGPMKAFDVVYDGESSAKIAVLVPKKKGELDKDALKKAAAAIAKRGLAGQKASAVPPVAAPPPMGPGGPPPMGPMGPPPMGPAGPPPGGLGGGRGGEGGGLGMGGEGGYQQAGQRVEQVLTYIPLADIERAAGEGKAPAMTVIPTRMVVVNATFPLKAQAEELRKALRLPAGTKEQPYDVTQFVKFDGFRVKRRVIAPDGSIDGTDKKYADVAGTRPDLNGTPEAGWFLYNYEARYQALLSSRFFGTHPEGSDPNDKTGVSQYLPYFYRYEDKMVMMLPSLVPELGKYPTITLPSVLKTIDEMKKAAAPRVEQGELLKRLQGKEGAGVFTPATGTETGGSLYGQAPGLGAAELGKKGAEGGPGAGQAAPAGVTIDDVLLRFVDPDVRPGMTYEYMIQVRMLNPNYGKEQEKHLSIPAQAKVRTLDGPWARLNQPLTVPTEGYLYAYDTKTYLDGLDKQYGKGTPLYRRMDLPAGNTHAVVEKTQWLEQVRISGTQREPVGAWVAAQMPVPRGGYIGRKTFVELPLWSSEETKYNLREVSTEKLGKVNKEGKDTQPKGWLVDFSGRDVLVDFEGGKVSTRVGSAVREDEVQTELLIVRPDGRLSVRRSGEDMPDPTRQQAVADFAKWVNDVKTGAAATGGAASGFAPKN